MTPVVEAKCQLTGSIVILAPLTVSSSPISLGDGASSTTSPPANASRISSVSTGSSTACSAPLAPARLLARRVVVETALCPGVG
jgi:hypothetical protein